MRSAASSTSPSASSRFLPTSRLISAASSLDRSLIRSAAARSTATRSGQGVRAHRPAAADAARTASSTSAGVAECTRHSVSDRSPGLVTVNSGPPARGSPLTYPEMSAPSQLEASRSPAS